MRSSRCLLAGLGLTAAFGCTNPDRQAFPEGAGGGTSSTGDAPASGSTTTSNGSTSSANAGGGDPGAGAGGSTTTTVGPGGGDGGSPGNGGGGNEPVGPGGNGGQGGTGGETTSGGGGGEGPICDPVDNACLPAVPGGGWVGPVALFEVGPADPLPACNLTGWPTALGDYFGDLDEGTAACDCDCSAAQGIVCSGNGSYCGHSNLSGCNLACSTTAIAPNVCLTATSPNYLSVFQPAPTNVGTCNATPTVELPTPAWGVKARACQGASTTPDGCDAGEVCAPRPAAGEVCIVQAGDVECPAGDWSVRHLRHTSFDDTRSCSACSCGSATSTCGGRITFTNFGCDDLPEFVDEVNAGSCSQLDDAQNMLFSYSPSGTCPPVGGALSGDVTVDGTATYCCVE